MSVIIVGGGITGSVLALILSHMTNGQLSVHLIESTAILNTKLDIDTRAIVLAQGTCRYLDRIGIWKTISDCFTPIKIIYVSDYSYIGRVIFDAKDYNIDALGQVVMFHEIKIRLFYLLKKAPGVTIYCPMRAVNIIRSEFFNSIVLNNGDILEAKLIVAADGYCSSIASQCGIKWWKQPYNQVAIVADISTSSYYEGHAWEYFTKYGSLAILPTSHKRTSLIWCHSLEKKDQILSLSSECFCAELQKIFGWQLGYITHVGKRTSYPLTLTRATRFITHRMVLVGDASQTLHPIAGQGLNLGLRDVIVLAEILVKVWSKRQDYGEYSVLSCYQQRRQSDKIATINMTNGLTRIFASCWMPLIIFRNVGLIAMELFPPLRNMLARRALGWVIH